MCGRVYFGSDSENETDSDATEDVEDEDIGFQHDRVLLESVG